MIERFYLRDFLSFSEATLEFNRGLIVFSGPSGSGKSILMRAILSSFGLDSVDAAICESSVAWKIDDEFALECDDINVFKQIKKDKTRYFINNQSVSRLNIKEIGSKHIRHLSLKDYSDFSDESLLNLVDSKITNSEFLELKNSHRESFLEYRRVKKELESLEQNEQDIAQIREFGEFEISKIDSLNLKAGEDEELNEIKKQLSKKEKITEAISKSSGIFEFENSVSSLLSQLEIDSAFFDDAMGELASIFENTTAAMESLEDISIEDTLNRIESIADIKRRYGSIEQALEYRQLKARELAELENIEFNKEHLKKEIATLEASLEISSQKMREFRLSILDNIKSNLDEYLQMLYLRRGALEITDSAISESGFDRVALALENTSIDKLSSGEFNRLRLALLSIGTDSLSGDGGVLMLDEIDANLSGEESMSVAKVLRHLSSKYQIFVISHQPQLTSMGEQHFLISKDTHSSVRELDDDERIEEIARIISGDTISIEARKFAADLYNSARGYR